MHTIIKRVDSPDETRQFEKGRFDIVKLGDMVIGRASYEPGWRWSEHVGSQTGTMSCQVEGATSHNVSLHFMGVDEYAT